MSSRNSRLNAHFSDVALKHSKNMEIIQRDDFLKDILVILRETVEGSPEGQSSAYLDRGIGIFPTIEKLTANEASSDVHGTTIAGQIEHAKFYLDRTVEFIKGRTEAVNWDQSWLIEDVNDAEWDALRAAVRKSYDDVLRCFAEVETWNQDNIGDAVAIIAHTAYHLGAIRQIAKNIRRP